jgi:hypothetical protein
MPLIRLARVSKRGKLLLPEIVLAKGPALEGAPGAGDLASLYGSDWVGIIDKDSSALRTFRLYMGSWVEQAPLNGFVFSSTARHLTLAFDQNARQMIAWEEGGAVYLRRWQGSAYATLGPFAGADPLLVPDVLAHGNVPTSDLLLYHLSADRLSLSVRVQSANFGVANPQATFTAARFLDQAFIAAKRIKLLAGDDAAVLDGTMLESLPYPIFVTDSFFPNAVPRDGQYVPSVVRVVLPAELPVLPAAVPRDGSYASAVMTLALPAELPVLPSAVPQNGVYVSAVLNVIALEKPILPNAIPQNGQYAFASIQHSRVDGVTASAVPQNGAYFI